MALCELCIIPVCVVWAPSPAACLASSAASSRVRFAALRSPARRTERAALDSIRRAGLGEHEGEHEHRRGGLAEREHEQGRILRFLHELHHEHRDVRRTPCYSRTRSRTSPRTFRRCKGHSKKRERGTITKIPQLLRPPYLPPRAPRKAAPKGAGAAGEVARYHGRFWFCCAHALMFGFQYKCPPSPLAI